MIAKPSKKTIPIAIALVLLVALLGWLFGESSRGRDENVKSKIEHSD
jgi:hypothetical protein